jgi:hypothetical protein
MASSHQPFLAHLHDLGIDVIQGPDIEAIMRKFVRELCFPKENTSNSDYVVALEIYSRNLFPILSSFFRLQIKTICLHNVSSCNVRHNVRLETLSRLIPLDDVKAKKLLDESWREEIWANKEYHSTSSAVAFCRGFCIITGDRSSEETFSSFECACGITGTGCIITYVRGVEEALNAAELVAYAIYTTTRSYESELKIPLDLVGLCPLADSIRSKAFALAGFHPMCSLDIIRCVPVRVHGLNANTEKQLEHRPSSSGIIQKRPVSDEIYLLMGQSNMAGRGEVEDIVSVRIASSSSSSSSLSCPFTYAPLEETQQRYRKERISNSHCDCLVLGDCSCCSAKAFHRRISYFDPRDGWVSFSAG